jgi:hypothetical protein
MYRPHKQKRKAVDVATNERASKRLHESNDRENVQVQLVASGEHQPPKQGGVNFLDLPGGQYSNIDAYHRCARWVLANKRALQRCAI